MRNTHRLVVLAGPLLAGAAIAGEVSGDLRSRIAANPFAFIPPQCYTRTTGAGGADHNPCYTCHVASEAPNYNDDGDLQTAYDFPGPVTVNPWSNLRRSPTGDRRDADDAMLADVRADNYHRDDGIALDGALSAAPPEWDIDGNGVWGGYRPDIWFDFDAEGYDRDPAGARTGWRAFAYAPLSEAFWPANSSADDMAIRLPEAFRQNADGAEDWTVYAANLAIVEALVKRRTSRSRQSTNARSGSISTATAPSALPPASCSPSTRATA